MILVIDFNGVIWRGLHFNACKMPFIIFISTIQMSRQTEGTYCKEWDDGQIATPNQVPGHHESKNFNIFVDNTSRDNDFI